MQEFTLPNLGENVTQGDVLRVLVKTGDRLKQDQPVLELETDKATIEVPSSVEGVVKEIRVKEGDKVKPGQAVLVVESNGAERASAPAEQQGKATDTAADTAADKTADRTADRTADPARQRSEKDAPAAAEAGASAPTKKQEQPPADRADEPPQKRESRDSGEPAAPKRDDRRASVVDIRGRQPVQAAAQAPSAAPAGLAAPIAPASPSVRRIAREIGVDIAQVTGTGAGGRITEADVKDFARHVLSSLGGGAIAPAPGRAPAPGPALPDFSKWGEIERKQMSGIRRKTAEHLAHAWSLVAHVTQFDKADMTVLEQIRPKYAAEAERLGGKLTVTAVVAKIVASALRTFPQFNASIDPANDSIIYKRYVHIGIAVDTDHGLLVPVVRDADKKNILQIAVEIHQLAEKARARKLSLEEMSGGSMSITNLGGIGGTAFTPIVNWPEVAILGISRGSVEPVFKDGKIEPRQMLPLSLSYDHRMIDGADAIRFLRWVVEAIEQPFTLALRG